MNYVSTDSAAVQKCITMAGSDLISYLKEKLPIVSLAVTTPEGNTNLTAHIEAAVADLVEMLSTT